MTDRVIPCLWFNGDAEEAVSFYVSLVPGLAHRLGLPLRRGRAGRAGLGDDDRSSSSPAAVTWR